MTGGATTFRGARVPDFVIVGAMKAGTTSLHHHLVASGGIAIPDPELYLFDVDDPSCHPQLHRGMLQRGPRTYAADFDRLFEEYRRHFADLPADVLVGEDSTTYLYSRAAPARMRAVLGEAKVVVMLRDPVDRAVSHYWHLVQRRAAALPLERAVVDDPSLVARSTYVPGIERFRQAFGLERVHVALMEDLAHDPVATVNGVREFLGLAPATIADRPASNRGTYPSREWPLRWRNRLAPARHTEPAVDRARPDAARGGRATTARRRLVAWSGRVLGGPTLAAPRVPAHVRAYLSGVLTVANDGLDELLGRDLRECWPSWSPPMAEAATS